MTSFWLFLSSVFKFSFGFYTHVGYFFNWVLFIVGCVFFLYWCYVLIAVLGGNQDKEYYSPTEGKFPYYDPERYSKKEEIED